MNVSGVRMAVPTSLVEMIINSFKKYYTPGSYAQALLIILAWQLYVSRRWRMYARPSGVFHIFLIRQNLEQALTVIIKGRLHELVCIRA
jgi:hypothetical protein